MSVPIHHLHIHQKPKLGNGFMRRLPVFNYRHSISAIGGFDTASCDVALRSQSEMEQFLDQYIGNRVAFYVDDPIEPIWEGFINRMSFSAGGTQHTISLDEMANRVHVQYTDVSAGATNTTLSTGANDTASQAIYGIKYELVDLGRQRLVGTALAATRDTILSMRAWPKASKVVGGNSGFLHIEMQGFYHTLNWEIYTNASASTPTLYNIITTQLLPGLVNGTTFFNRADFTDISANTLTLSAQKTVGSSAWEALQEIQEVGNASNYFVIGITPTLFQTGTRRLYYRQANTAIAYTARQSDGLRVRNPYGKLIRNPWTVRPDCGIRITDTLIGWDGQGDNPNESYVKVIQYDANQQSIIWSGDDDIRVEGVFQLRRYGKPVNRRFGAVRRTV